MLVAGWDAGCCCNNNATNQIQWRKLTIISIIFKTKFCLYSNQLVGGREGVKELGQFCFLLPYRIFFCPLFSSSLKLSTSPMALVRSPRLQGPSKLNSLCWQTQMSSTTLLPLCNLVLVLSAHLHLHHRVFWRRD
jgi:hypothetical protein